MDENNYEDKIDNDPWDEEDEPEEDGTGVTVDAVISECLLLEHARASGARLERIQRASDDLRRFFDTVADRVMTTPEFALRDLELLFRPEGAAARVADAYALLYALPRWLEEPQWHGKDLEDRRVRVQLTQSLTRFVTRLPRFDGPGGGNCSVWDIEAAARRARQEISAVRSSTAETRAGSESR